MGSVPARPRLLVLDANALIHRAFHALPPLTSPSGEPAGALYGLCLTLLNVLRAFKPTHLVAAFDRPEKTFRHEQFPEYKAQRERAPVELGSQIARARDVFAAFAIPVVDALGYEADDVIGTFTAQAAAEKLDTVIVTGDQDTMQLVDDHVRVHLLRRGVKDTVTMGPAEVRERYGLIPAQMVDFKALRGDPSDNIAGVRGIGEKTATDLLQRFGSLDRVYAHLAEVPEAVRRKLVAGRADAVVSKRLVTIVRDVPLSVKLDDLARSSYDRSRAIELFRELGFASLLPRLPEPEGQTGRSSAGPSSARAKVASRRTAGYQLLTEARAVEALAKRLSASEGFVVDTETERLGARTEALHGVSVSLKEGEAAYVPAAHVPLLRRPLEQAAVPKWGHNLKYDLEVLLRAGIRPRPLAFDTMLASYVLASGTRAHDLDTLTFTILGREKIPITSLIGKGRDQKTLSAAPLDAVAEYSCEDADMTLRLKRHFDQTFADEPILRRVFEELEVPLIPVLAHLELAGVKLDASVLRRLDRTLARKLAALERRIHSTAGGSFNIASPPQLRVLLFEKLQLPTAGITRTQTGLSTAAEELEKLRGAHPIIPFIQEYRELAKLKNTYLDALPELVDPETGRVYTTYNQTVAATGRLSSQSPNLQNIPIRTKLGQEIRKAFVAERGHTLLAADYSQLQLRLAAHLAQDRAMQAAFRAGKDIHAETAAFAFSVPVERVTSAQRRVAKTLNFGILYGMGPGAFARAADISLSEAQRFFDAYFRTYRGIAEFMEEVKAAAAAQGFVETITGRRRYLPEIASRNPQIRGEAERMAINHPAQGSEADIMKKAMIAVYARLEAAAAPFRDVRLILQVHDELVFEVPRGKEAAVGAAVRAIMEDAARLSVPLVVDVRSGPNWGTLTDLSLPRRSR